MTREQILAELQTLALSLDITIRYEKGDFEGGFCILRAERIIVINKKLMLPKKVSVLARSLGEFGTDSVFIKPALRDFIEEEMAKAASPRRESDDSKEV